MNLHYKYEEKVNEIYFTISPIITSLGPSLFTAEKTSSVRIYQIDKSTARTIRAPQKHSLKGKNRRIQPMENRRIPNASNLFQNIAKYTSIFRWIDSILVAPI